MASTKPLFSKKALIPLWTLQLLILLVYLGLILFVWIWAREVTGASIALFIICIMCTILNIFEIITFAKNGLRVVQYFVFQVVMATIWLVLLVFGIVATVTLEQITEGDGYRHGAIFWYPGLILLVIAFILFLSSLIYASVIYHRYRRSKKIYARAGSQDSGRAMHNLQDLESGVSNPPTYTYAPHPLSSPSPAEIQHSWSRGQTYMGKQNVMVPSNTMSAEPTGPPTVHEAPSSNTN